MSTDAMQQLWNTAYLGSGSAAYLEELYERYLADPHSVDPSWRARFQQLPTVEGVSQETAHSTVQAAFLHWSKNPIHAQGVTTQVSNKQALVDDLIDAFRRYGHEQAHLDPLEQNPLPHVPELTLAAHHLNDADLSQTFLVHGMAGHEKLTLKQLYSTLQSIYCGTVGIEYTYIRDPKERNWLIQRIEKLPASERLTTAEKKRLLSKLTAAEGIERYLHAKYVGQKRFSLEGGDTLIPMMDHLTQHAGSMGVKEIVIGMAHRGRLNMLINILGKLPSDLFEEFEGKKEIVLPSGDVKYHQGFSSNIKTEGGVVHLALAFNPSHLEIVSPVVEGAVRARQMRRHDDARKQVLPILLHGDAAFAGQGVVLETLNMSQLRGYKTGGSVHIVVNNQVGFTTSDRQDARSSYYCTDIAKMIDAPVFHVNADDPEAAWHWIQVALEYRMTFGKDVVIDLVCYRRHGHNEADEPSATQPMMYQKIKAHATVRTLYAQQLIKQGLMTEQEDTQLVEQYRAALDAGRFVVEELCAADENALIDWNIYKGQDWTVAYKSAFNQKHLIELGRKLTQFPADLTLQAQVKKGMQEREKMTAGNTPLDWGYAENLAYATLLDAGYAVRMTGQDCGRGTFAHRHAVLHDQNSSNTYIPLEHLNDKQGNFTIIDSFLSEEAVLGFEYGYATTDPRGLVIWEAQFGDFANGAQVVIDQFISSGEQKWGRLCGLVMLLPHGYEGMGPEHSSARLERYLQLCAEHNMQVCVPSTPAQVYHMLRRQAVRAYRRPLVVMTPKSLLRHRLAVSSLAELSEGTFQPVLGEVDILKSQDVKKVILCSGKVYYDLLTKRRELKQTNAAIIRIEQLYPFPADLLRAEMQKYPQAKTVVWCQEEPKNQGAWYSARHHLEECLIAGQQLEFAGREASASPAVGYSSLHTKQQQMLVDAALA